MTRITCVLIVGMEENKDWKKHIKCTIISFVVGLKDLRQRILLCEVKYMSQAKVDYKKEQRKNIKKIVRKRKVSHVIGITAFVLVACGMIGWLGYSGYQTYTEAKANDPASIEEIPVDLDAISDYLTEITPEEETEEVTEESSEDTAEENSDSEEENAEESAEENIEETTENEASDEE